MEFCQLTSILKWQHHNIVSLPNLGFHKYNNQLLIIILLITLIDKISMTDTQSAPSQWQPIFKTKNVTKDWKFQSFNENSDTYRINNNNNNNNQNNNDNYNKEPTSSKTTKGHKSSIASSTVQASHQDYQGPIQLTPSQLSRLPQQHQYNHFNNLHRYHQHAQQHPHYDLSAMSSSPLAARYEPVPEADASYYYYAPPGLPTLPSGPPGPPGPASLPPIYGPPLPPLPPGPEQSISIELAFDRLVLRCVVQEPLEHISWTRFPCPNEYFYGNGIPVADGSVVHNVELYDVRIVGENGEIASELLLRSPLEPTTSGLYVCEAWPHYHKPDPFGAPFQPPVYPPVTDVFIIGGSELIDQCYNNRPPFRQFNVHRKRYDEDNENSGNVKKTTEPNLKNTENNNKKATKQNVNDPARKPRNITRQLFGRNEEFINFNQNNNDNYQKLRVNDKHRYNFKFDNSTNIYNATATDIFRPVLNSNKNNYILPPFNKLDISSNEVINYTRSLKSLPINNFSDTKDNSNKSHDIISSSSWAFKYVNNNSTQTKPIIIYSSTSNNNISSNQQLNNNNLKLKK